MAHSYRRTHVRIRDSITIVAALSGILLLGGCTIRLVSSYDAVIDDGLRDYRESINVFVKNMADVSGTTAGTYDANRATYNKLDTQIGILIDRARFSGGQQGCRLAQAVTDDIVAAMGANMPGELLPASQRKDGDALGCMHRLLELIHAQLLLLQNIHANTDKCGNPPVSCLRPATAKTALDITNQAINAAWVVEIAEKKGSED